MSGGGGGGEEGRGNGHLQFDQAAQTYLDRLLLNKHKSAILRPYSCPSRRPWPRLSISGGECFFLLDMEAYVAETYGLMVLDASTERASKRAAEQALMALEDRRRQQIEHEQMKRRCQRL